MVKGLYKLSKELRFVKKQTILLKPTRNSHAEYQLPYDTVKENIIFQHSQETIREVGELVISQFTFYSRRNNYPNKTIVIRNIEVIYKQNSCILVHPKLYLTYTCPELFKFQLYLFVNLFFWETSSGQETVRFPFTTRKNGKNKYSLITFGIVVTT